VEFVAKINDFAAYKDFQKQELTSYTEMSEISEIRS
jgi:hypothetical protein